MGLLRSALITVAAVAVLLAGFVGIGGVIGLWDPVPVPSSADRSSAQKLHSGDANPSARMATEAPPDPTPPVSGQSALLVGFAAAALALMLTAVSRAARWLSDFRYSLQIRPTTGFHRTGRLGEAAWPVLGGAVRSRARHTGLGSVGPSLRSILAESSESLVVFGFSVALGVGLGILVALYVN
jgi:hypothetical protein